MADPVLKFPPEQKGNPASPTPQPKLAAEPRRRLMAGMRRYRRFLLLVVLPLVALVAGVTFYLNGGRYVTTDDAYVGAQKVLITPDISGKIEKVVVKEGQQVAKGQKIAEMGNTDADQVKLHFEIRRQGKPVDPLRYLPPA